jgi:integrase
MKLSEAIEFTFENRDSWREGKGAGTARINARHVMRILGDIDMEEIKTKHFTQISQQLKKEGKSDATINRVTAVLSTVFTELAQNGYEYDRPSYKHRKEPKGRVTYYTEDEINSLLEAASQRRDALLLHDSILMSIKTGCRQGELLRLTDDDIDFENKQIIFRDTKNGTDHVIPMSVELVPLLVRRLDLRISGELFPWDKDTLLREFKKLRNELGIDQTKVWHTLRHTTATWLVSKNVPLRVIMSVLNHSNVSTTLRYAKAADTAVKDALELL